MIVIPHKQPTKQIPTSNGIFSGNETKEDFSSLFERAEDGFNQASSPEILRIRIPD